MGGPYDSLGWSWGQGTPPYPQNVLPGLERALWLGQVCVYEIGRWENAAMGVPVDPRNN